jgi:hypothetical protein
LSSDPPGNLNYGIIHILSSALKSHPNVRGFINYEVEKTASSKVYENPLGF